MAGIGTETVEAAFPQARVVRVMPNIAMSVGCGASGVAPGKTATDADVEKVVGIFACGGVAVKIDESEIDDVAALSGSGAAYVYLLIEALRDAAIEDGMAPEKAAMLARQTLIGAARQLEAEDVPPRSSAAHHLQEGHHRGRDKGHVRARPPRGREGRVPGQQEALQGAGQGRVTLRGAFYRQEKLKILDI